MGITSFSGQPCDLQKEMTHRLNPTFYCYAHPPARPPAPPAPPAHPPTHPPTAAAISTTDTTSLRGWFVSRTNHTVLIASGGFSSMHLIARKPALSAQTHCSTLASGFRGPRFSPGYSSNHTHPVNGRCTKRINFTTFRDSHVTCKTSQGSNRCSHRTSRLGPLRYCRRPIQHGESVWASAGRPGAMYPRSLLLRCLL